MDISYAPTMPLKLNTSYGLPKSVLVMGGACAAVVALLVFFAFGRWDSIHR